jgi:hypothetical protein
VNDAERSAFERTGRLHGSGRDGVNATFGNGPTGLTPWPRVGRLKGEPAYDDELVQVELRKKPADIVLQNTDPRELWASQGGLVKQHVEYYLHDLTWKLTAEPSADKNQLGNRFPVVYFRDDGRRIILSGHHRAAAALLNGEPLKARIVTGGKGRVCT